MSAERETFQLTLHKVASDEVLEINDTIEFKVADVGGPHIVNANDLIVRIEDAIHRFESGSG